MKPWGESSQRKLLLSILVQIIMINLEKKISRIFVTFTRDINIEQVVMLNKPISAKAMGEILQEKDMSTWGNKIHK